MTMDSYFNPDHMKHTQEVIFSKKTTKASHSKVFFNIVQLLETFGGS